MSEHRTFGETLAGLAVPIHPDGVKYVAACAGGAFLLMFLWPGAGWLLVALTLWLYVVFRDPNRVVPLREGLVVAPSDGWVTAVETVTPPPELGFGAEPRTRIAILPGPFDPLVQRSPVAGTVRRVAHLPGGFVPGAGHAESDSGERVSTVIATAAGDEIAIVRIAGLWSRGVTASVVAGDGLGVGERVGLIRLNGRVEVFLPPSRGALVAVGQRAVAGETVICDLKSDEPAREARTI